MFIAVVNNAYNNIITALFINSNSLLSVAVIESRKLDVDSGLLRMATMSRTFIVIVTVAVPSVITSGVQL